MAKFRAFERFRKMNCKGDAWSREREDELRGALQNELGTVFKEMQLLTLLFDEVPEQVLLTYIYKAL